MYQNIPDNVQKILESIEKAGFEAYLVGGCVRDMLLGKEPHDYDIATSALPENIKNIFPHTADTGLKHGTVTVISDGMPIEVTTFRTESGYTDMRHPENVCFISDIKEDLRRRDFTVNAIAYNKRTGLVDPFGGEKDINERILRAVGNPDERFSEDALRILRLFRFASVLGFSCEESTLSSALKLAVNLSGVSSERIAEELRKAVNGENTEALSPLIKSGALNFLFINYDRLQKIKSLPAGNLKMFAFLYLCSTSPVETAEVLKFSNKEKKYITDMMGLLSFELMGNSLEVKYALKDSGDVFEDYLTFLTKTLGKNTERVAETYRKITENGEPYRLSDLNISGDDLKKLGFEGKRIGFILDFLLQKVIEEPGLNTKENLLKIVKS